MARKRSFDLVDLDYESQLASFKNFLKKQPQFADYDFRGANLRLLLELLAFNTSKMAFYTNMGLSERFIDSAQLRSSIVSHAKELNYIPRSIRSAKARVRVSFTASGASQPYVIPKGSGFTSLIKTDSYDFTIPETMTLASTNNSYEFVADIYEGLYVRDRHIVEDDATLTYRLTNKNVDTRSISVTVYEDNSEIGSIYKLRTSLLDVTEKDKIFFLQSDALGYYEIFFGDGILGKKPKSGSLVSIDYRISRGPDGNGAREFHIAFDPTGFSELTSDPVIETLESSHNGDVEELSESVRYYAPRHYQVQERTVIDQDYSTALKVQFPEINAVTVFGGEHLDPPRYGKVVISVDISNIDGLPPIKKDEYAKFLERRMPFCIDPIFQEPNFIFVGMNILVRYDPTITTNSPNRIKTMILEDILEYNRENLNDFDSVVRYSDLVALIDNTEASIVSNITETFVYKKTNPILGQAQRFEVNFNMELEDDNPTKDTAYPVDERKTLWSSPFVYRGTRVIIEDDGNGKVRIVEQRGNQKVALFNVGTIDYNTGFIEMPSFVPDLYDDNYLKFYAYPRDKDIRSPKNNIMNIEASDIVMEIEDVVA